MKLIIHRGTHEIGGSCVEIKSAKSRIILDIGMPLVEKSGEKFNFNNYKYLNGSELVKQGILPNVKGLYKWDKTGDTPDGILISHAHIDHYGFYNYLNDDVRYYLGEGTKRMIDISAFFLDHEGKINKFTFINSGKPFKVGSFTITPYLMDHSAFDAYAFLIEADGKKILYSGDFREHGRKFKAFQWFLTNVPKDIDALLMEGSTLGREEGKLETEQDVEDSIVKTIDSEPHIIMGVASSQNIDRLVTFYKAALRTKRLFAIDVYTANILENIKDIAKVPYPSKEYKNLRVFFPKFTCDKLARKHRTDLMNRFSKFKITKEEISQNAGNIVMMVRPSMIFDLSRIKNIGGSIVIYSMWEGYLKEKSIHKFLQLVKEKSMQLVIRHTSGHAAISTLKKVVSKIKPKVIIPIHTFYPEQYKDLFKGTKVLNVSDDEEIDI